MIVGKWTDQDIEWLKQNHRLGIKHAMNHLNRSYSSITQQLFRLRLASRAVQIKEIVKAPTKSAGQVQSCNLPVFHPVMLGIYPTSRMGKRKGSGSTGLWRKRRALILKIHDELCVYCGDEAETVDHIIPLMKGGTDDPLNLVAACGKCNYAFGDKTKHIEMRIA